MIKKSILLIGISILIQGIGTLAHECHIFTDTSIKSFQGTLFESSTKGNPVVQAISPEGIHRALINLKTHCCAANILNNNSAMLKSCKNDAILLKERTNYAQSAFLFDQLLDVMMRRLAVDGKFSDVPDDKKAQERRKKIDTITNKEDGVLPIQIGKEYEKYRKPQAQFYLPKYNGVSAQEYQNTINNLEKEKKILSKYEERNLTTRYYNLCQNIIYLMTFLPVSFESEQLALAQERCTSLTEQTINNEAEYLHHIIVQKSDLLLGQTMKNYAEEYLINTRAEQLQERLSRMMTNLMGIMRMIPKLVPNCS
ncbi:MAG: hypothetical protein DLD55_00525 [candidate division SR1 bacterium]|nr:MAG: hypothetical protein DLD55_00525 [candidate division SR1 bacterium]